MLGMESQERREAREEAEHAERVKQAKHILTMRAVERSRQLERERGHAMTKAEFYVLAREVFAEHGLALDISEADIAAAEKETSLASPKQK